MSDPTTDRAIALLVRAGYVFVPAADSEGMTISAILTHRSMGFAQVLPVDFTPMALAKAAIHLGCPHADPDHPGALDVVRLAAELLGAPWSMQVATHGAVMIRLLTQDYPGLQTLEDHTWPAALDLLRQVVEVAGE